MYGYPEQFIPAPEVGAAVRGPGACRARGGHRDRLRARAMKEEATT